MKVKKSKKEIAVGRIQAFLEKPEYLDELTDHYCDSLDPLRKGVFSNSDIAQFIPILCQECEFDFQDALLEAVSDRSEMSWEDVWDTLRRVISMYSGLK